MLMCWRLCICPKAAEISPLRPFQDRLTTGNICWNKKWFECMVYGVVVSRFKVKMYFVFYGNVVKSEWGWCVLRVCS